MRGRTAHTGAGVSTAWGLETGTGRQTPEEPLEEVQVPRVHLDYFFMSREDQEACKNPLLVMADERSGSRYARAVGAKGLGGANSMDWLTEDISARLKSLGMHGARGEKLSSSQTASQPCWQRGVP